MTIAERRTRDRADRRGLSVDWSEPAQAVSDRPRVSSALSIRKVAVTAAIIFLLCAAVPWVISHVLPPTFGAQSELLLKPRAELSDTAVERAMLTEEAIIKSPSVLGPVADQAGVSLQTLHSAVTATIVGRSNILQVTVADQNRERALSIARGIERQYAKLHAGDAKVDPSSVDPPALTYSVLTPAHLLDDPVGPWPLQFLAAGCLVGLLAASVVVVTLLRHRLFGRQTPRA